jgi:hypothetical protein
MSSATLLLGCWVASATTAEAQPEAKISLAVVSDDEAWAQSGFRAGIGYAFDEVAGLASAPEGAHHSLVVRLGARLDEDWSILGTLRYGVRPGRYPGLRYSGTIEPTLHLGGLDLAFGLGIGGYVISTTGEAGYDGGPLIASYTVPDDRARLTSCSGSGVLGLFRAEYPIPINDLLALGPVFQVDAQWTRCTQTTGQSDPDTAEAIELHQYWGHYSIGFGWMTWWR